MRMDYLRALDRPSVEIAGRSVQRASLRQFFQLQEVLRRGDEDGRIVAYVAMAADIPFDTVAGWFFGDVVDAFEVLKALNTPMLLHIDFAKGAADNNAYHYDNRALAMIVTRLASAFGWSRDAILDQLTFDEARCYLQELALSDHEEKRYLYSLSELAYDGQGHAREFPPPAFPTTLGENDEVPGADGTAHAVPMPVPMTFKDERLTPWGVVPVEDIPLVQDSGR